MEQRDRQAAGSAQDCHHGEIVDILAAPTISLVAIGAASALNCADCLRHLVPAALKNGILAEEISAALAVVSEIRTRSGVMTDDLSAVLVPRVQARSKDDDRTVQERRMPDES